MDYFLEQVQMLLPVLGFSFLQTLPSHELLRSMTGSTGTPEASPLFYLNSPRGINAEAREINGDFIVLAGSHAKKDASPSLQEAHLKRREQLRQDKKLVENEQMNLLRFTEDVLFTSPSAAASVVTETPSNGRILWKVKDSGQTYKDWKSGPLQTTNEDSL